MTHNGLVIFLALFDPVSFPSNTRIKRTKDTKNIHEA